MTETRAGRLAQSTTSTFWRTELERTLREHRRAGHTLDPTSSSPLDRHQIHPDHVDRYLTKLCDRAAQEELDELVEHAAIIGQWNREQRPAVLARAFILDMQVKREQREARELQVRKLRMQMATRLRGIEPMTERERAAVARVTTRQRIHDVLQNDQ